MIEYCVNPYNSGSTNYGGGGGGAKNMKYKLLHSAAIFFMAIYYRPERGAWPTWPLPRIRYCLRRRGWRVLVLDNIAPLTGEGLVADRERSLAGGLEASITDHGKIGTRGGGRGEDAGRGRTSFTEPG